jgi:hypothetical protein
VLNVFKVQFPTSLKIPPYNCVFTEYKVAPPDTFTFPKIEQLNKFTLPPPILVTINPPCKLTLALVLLSIRVKLYCPSIKEIKANVDNVKSKVSILVNAIFL